MYNKTPEACVEIEKLILKFKYYTLYMVLFT